MGYPMSYARVVRRNGLCGDYARSVDGLCQPEQALSFIRGDMRRLENDSRDDAHLREYAERAGITTAQAKAVLDLFFDHCGGLPFTEGR